MDNRLKVRVYHSGYGCETGCCGHIVSIGPEDDDKEEFEFEHPWDAKTEEDKKAWAKEFAEEVIRKNWPECLDSIDWDSMEIDISTDGY